MTKKIGSLLSFLGLVLSLSARPAGAIEVTALGGLNMATEGSENIAQFSYGGLVGFSLIPALVSLETGVLMVPVKTGTSSYAFVQSFMNIPLVARFPMVPFVTPGVGVSYSRSADEIGVAVPDHTTYVKQERTSFTSLTLSVQKAISLAPMLRWVFDARYLLAIGETGFNSAQGFTGVQVGF